MSTTKITKNRNYTSRFDENRPCFRLDETTYVYREYRDKDTYIDHTFTVEDGSCTLELFDSLQAMDNAEAQDTEDIRKHSDNKFENSKANAEDSDSDTREGGFDTLDASRIADDLFAGAGGVEEDLFGEPKSESRMLRLFNKYVLPELSEKELGLIYDYYGMGMFAKDIAAKTFKKNGHPLTESAVTKQIRLLKAKVEALIAEHIDEK